MADVQTYESIFSKCVGPGNCWTTKGPIKGPTQCKGTNGYYRRISQVTQETNLQTHTNIQQFSLLLTVLNQNNYFFLSNYHVFLCLC